MPGNPWWAFLAEQLADRGWSPADLARASGVSQGRIAHWRDAGAPPSIKNARAVANALGVPVLVVLVAAGILTAEEANLPERSNLDSFSTLQLLRELEGRFDEVQQSRHRLADGLVSSGGVQRERVQTHALFAEAEEVIKLREAARPLPRPKLRSVADDPDESHERNSGSA